MKKKLIFVLLLVSLFFIFSSEVYAESCVGELTIDCRIHNKESCNANQNPDPCVGYTDETSCFNHMDICHWNYEGNVCGSNYGPSSCFWDDAKGCGYNGLYGYYAYAYGIRPSYPDPYPGCLNTICVYNIVNLDDNPINSQGDKCYTGIYSPTLNQCEGSECDLANQCIDSDGGINLDVKGTAIDTTRSITDFCEGNFTIFEAFCDDQNNAVYANRTCALENKKCGYGACVSSIAMVTNSLSNFNPNDPNSISNIINTIKSWINS